MRCMEFWSLLVIIEIMIITVVQRTKLTLYKKKASWLLVKSLAWEKVLRELRVYIC